MTVPYRFLLATFTGLMLWPLSGTGAVPDSLAVDPEAEPRWWGADAGSPTVPFPYVYEPVGSWVYDEIQRQMAQGNLQGMPHNSRVLPRALIAARVAEALRAGKRSVGLERLARELAWEGRMMRLDLPYRDTRPMITLGPPESMVKFNGLLSAGGAFEQHESPDFSYRSVLGFRGSYWHPSGFSLGGDFIITQVPEAWRFGDPIFEDSDIQFNTPRFAAAWHGKFFEVWFGRETLQWGPGRRGGLVVGGGSPPYVQLGYRVYLGTFLTATAAHGWLTQAEQRFTASHRIEMKLGNFRLGVQEAVRYDAAAPEPYYLINIIPYSAVERLLTADGTVGANRDSLYRSNYILSTDLYWKAAPGWALYGEFMIDDIRRDNGLFDPQPEEGVPVRIGYQFGGIHVHEGSRRLTLQAEYTRVYNYTYAVWYGRNFFHQEVPLGYPMGADISDMNLWVDLDLDRDWSLTSRGYWTRVGEGNGAGPWCAEVDASDDCQTIGPASGSRFAGTVERRLGLELGGVFAPTDNLRFEATGGAVRVANLDHREGVSETRPTARLLAAWRW